MILVVVGAYVVLTIIADEAEARDLSNDSDNVDMI